MQRPPGYHILMKHRIKLIAYLDRFEKYAVANKWDREQWPVYISALLKGKALEVYHRLSAEDAADYEVIKGALLKNFDMTEQGFKRKFKSNRPEKSETFLQFVGRLSSYLVKWLGLAKVGKTYEELFDFLVRDQLLECGTSELYVYLRPKECRTAHEMAVAADLFAEAKGGVPSVIKRDSKPAGQSSSSGSNRGRQGDRRFESSRGKGWSGPWRGDSRRQFGQYSYRAGGVREEIGQRSEQRVTGIDTSWRETPESSRITYRGRGVGSSRARGNNRGRGRGQDKDRDKVDEHKVAFCKTIIPPDPELMEDVGIRGKVNTDVGNMQVNEKKCYFLRARLPTAEGCVEGEKVTVLRDTVCTGIVIRESLVDKSKVGDEQVKVTLIDDTVNSHKVAEVNIDCPFFTGLAKAILMKNPIYDLVIGNVDGSKLPDMSHFVTPVETRSQQVDQSDTRRVKVPSPIINVSKAEFQAEQAKDSHLDNVRKLARTMRETVYQGRRKGVVRFKYKNELLYREYESSGKKHTQLVVPSKYRAGVLKLAHEAIMAGHMGIKKTTERVLSEFYWPGVCGDTSRHCRSCDICQRTIPKGKVPRVPLGHTPLIDTPFQRVAVDIVGPIEPRSENRNRYILTMIDYATQIPRSCTVEKY